MKKYLSLIIVLIISLLSTNSFAYNAPDSPANGGYVLDESNKLSQVEINQLNSKIETLKQNTKNEFGVAIIQSTGGEDIAEVGQIIFRAWKIGDVKLNNGILLVIATAEHKTRIQTGKGVEGDLPDLKASDILAHDLKPYLKRGKFYDGINNTLDVISNSLDSRIKQPVVNPTSIIPTTGDNGFAWILGLLLFAGGCVGLFTFLSVKKQAKEDERLERIRNANKYRGLEAPTIKKHITTTKAVVAAAAVTTGAVIISEHEEENRKRRQREDDESRRRRSSEDSSYSSSSSWGSSDSGSFGGGGFGGGDSGGGGGSGDY